MVLLIRDNGVKLSDELGIHVLFNAILLLGISSFYVTAYVEAFFERVECRSIAILE